jgi:DNA-binding transcriptional MocR family regulator
MNVVISGSPLNETLAAHLLAQQEIVLAPRRTMLAKALIILADWHLSESDRLDWVCPDAGALSCFRLRRDQYDNQMVQQFWTALPKYDLQLGPGSWFGEKNQIFRLGFGYLPLEKLPRALELISETMSNTQELQTT